jgi:hypothetical protein
MPWFFHGVGAGLLAMVVNDNAGELDKRGALESIASRLAPMYGLAPTFNLLLNTAARLHLCIRPVRGSLERLLANIG